jgi:hypothetical protein
MSEFRNRDRAKQLIDFSGLRSGKKMPTDIDAFIDFGGRAFVFIEVKHGGADLPFGQRLALERLCDSVDDSIDAWVLVARHNTPVNEDVDLADAIVSDYRNGGRWRRTRREVDVKEFVDWIAENA